MAFDLNSDDARLIRAFIPINTLPGFRFDELCLSHQVSSAEDGQLLFTQGSSDTDYYFLLDGKISLQAGKTEVDTVKARTEVTRFALAHHIPRKVSCIAQGSVRYLKVDSEMFSQETVSQLLQASDLVGEESEQANEEAIPFLLKSPLFRQLFVSILPGVSACLKKATFNAGQTIIEQDKPNNTFYIIEEGRCKVTHRPFKNAKEIQLDELQQGDTFGEYALLIDGTADVTVKTLTDCVMYTIDEKHFEQWIKQPLMRQMEWHDADQSGDVFLDIQQLEDYRKTHVKGSINYPFSTLRVRMGQLADSETYIVVSQDEKTGMAATMMLRQQQLDVKILTGGLEVVPEGSLDHILMPDEEDSQLVDHTDNIISSQGNDSTKQRPHSVTIGSPIMPIKPPENNEQSENQDVLAVISEPAKLEPQSELVEPVDVKHTHDDNNVSDEKQPILLNNAPSNANLQVKKLEKKLSEVWKAYKKARAQLHKSKRKYSSCYHQYTRIEENYHSLLAQPAASGDTLPAINPAISNDEINERLRTEFTQLVKSNKKLKQQYSEVKKTLAELKKASKITAHPLKRSADIETEKTALIDDKSLLLKVEMLEETIQRLEQKKISQQKKARQYVDENNKLRQLIQELAKQAIEEQSQNHALSSFDFTSEIQSSDNAYESGIKPVAQIITKSSKDIEPDKALQNAFDSIDLDARSSLDSKLFDPKSKRSLGDRLQDLLKTTKKIAQSNTWIGIACTVLLSALLVALLVGTKQGQLLLQQIGL
jgi:CRP-like cAMP-binding protein